MTTSRGATDDATGVQITPARGANDDVRGASLAPDLISDRIRRSETEDQTIEQPRARARAASGDIPTFEQYLAHKGESQDGLDAQMLTTLQRWYAEDIVRETRGVEERRDHIAPREAKDAAEWCGRDTCLGAKHRLGAGGVCGHCGREGRYGRFPRPNVCICGAPFEEPATLAEHLSARADCVAATAAAVARSAQ